MEYRIRDSFEVIQASQLRARFPQSSFDPDNLTADVMEMLGVDAVMSVSVPAVSETQTVVRDGVEFVAGVWRQKWLVTTFSAEQILLLIEAKRTALIKCIDTDSDKIYADVIGSRATEYTQAEKEAQAYKDAAYTGTVPSSVQSWATVKAWTPTQSADDILAQATAWRTVAAAIRSNRLAEKEAARVATDLAEIAEVQTRWLGFVTYIRGQLGV